MRLQAPNGSAFLTVDSPEDESDTQADMGIHIDLISDEEDASRALVELNQNRSDAPQQVGAQRIRTVLHLRTSESMRGLWLEHASVRRSAHRPHGGQTHPPSMRWACNAVRAGRPASIDASDT